MTEVTLGPCRLICGDCLDVLPTLEEADQFITDPPYAANTHKQAKTNKGDGTGVKLIHFGCIQDDAFSAAVALMLSRCREWLVMTCDHRHAPLCFDLPEWVRLGAWVKPNPMPQISADRPGQGHEAVAILHAGKEPKRWNRGGGAGVWTFSPENEALQPTAKPEPLIVKFVQDFTQPGQLICDPFMGSGTTGIACIRTGRRFIGIEKDPAHFATAVARIQRELSQPMLFAPTERHEQPALI